MSAIPAPHIADASSRKHAPPDKTCATASAWLSLPEEENIRYLPKTTPLKPYISAHFISNDGAAAPKTSRRRSYTPAERKRVANTRKYGACKECRTRKVTCSHVPIPSAAVDDYLREAQRHEIFALALNSSSSAANVNVHKESMTKQIADIGDKLSEPQDNTKPSTGAATEALAGATAVKAVLAPAAPTPQPAPSRRMLKAPAQVYTATRARSPSRPQQPGTGKFRLPTKPTAGEGRVKRLKPDTSGSKNSAGRPTKTVEQLNAQASSNVIVISHEPPPAPAPAHLGKSHHEWREGGPQVVVTNYPPRASSNQNQQRFARETRLTASDARAMHQNSSQSLMRRASSSSGRDSLDSDMGEMITSSARSASSSGDFRPPTPLDFCYRFSPVIEKDITFTIAAVPTEYDVTESTNTQTLAPHPSADLPISWTELLNRELELDEDILDQDGMDGFGSNTCAPFPQKGRITMSKKAGQSATAKQPLLLPTEPMDVDKV